MSEQRVDICVDETPNALFARSHNNPSKQITSPPLNELMQVVPLFSRWASPRILSLRGALRCRLMAIEYRVGREDDLTGCLELEWTRPRDDLAWHLARDFLYVAVNGAIVVGFARLESFWRAMPYLALIVVREDTRANGVGSGLLAFMRADLRARGFRTLLSSTTGGEDGPRRWHLRNGFRDVGVLRDLNANGVDEVFYTLAL